MRAEVSEGGGGGEDPYKIDGNARREFLREPLERH